MMYLDILNFILAGGAVLSGLRIYKSRVQKNDFKPRMAIYFFIICLVLLWFINIYKGFIQ